MLPDDLKDYRADNGFELFTDGEALIGLAAILAFCFFVDWWSRIHG